MTPHIEKEICLKEAEWREVHEFIASTKPYRESLDKSIGGIRNGMWAVVLVVLIPFITGMVWIGEIKGTIERNTQDIEKIDTRLQAVERGTQVPVSRRLS